MSTPTDIPDAVATETAEESAPAQPRASRLNRKALIALAAIVGGVAVSFGIYGLYLLARAAAGPAQYGFGETREWVLTNAGLASLPMAALIFAFALALAFRRSWLRRWNVWIGAVLMTLAIAGGLAFHQPYSGPLAWFTPTFSGLPSLGGNVGDAVIGRVSYGGNPGV